MTDVMVVGAGEMGTGIAQLALAAGHHVELVDVSSNALDVARRLLARRLERDREKGWVDDEAGLLLQRLTTSSLDDRVRTVGLGVEVVIEAVPAVVRTKREVLSALSAATGDGTVIATTSLAVPVTVLLDRNAAQERVLGFHFMNPAPALRLCELVAPAAVAPWAVRFSNQFLASLGLTVVAAPDRPGFILNRTHVPFLLGAVDRVEEGCDPADVDTVFELGCRHPMGPLATADLVGLDAVLSISETLLAAEPNSRFAIPGLLRRKVEAGELGRKTGQGFFEYSP
jgi:3-hydroxybutyryl-CoA dehydrogenase